MRLMAGGSSTSPPLSPSPPFPLSFSNGTTIGCCFIVDVFVHHWRPTAQDKSKEFLHTTGATHKEKARRLLFGILLCQKLLCHAPAMPLTMRLCDYATMHICSRQGALVYRQQTIATTQRYATMRLCDYADKVGIRVGSFVIVV